MLKKALKVGAVGLLVLVALLGGLLLYSGFHLSSSLGKTYETPRLDISGETRRASIELGRRVVMVRNGCTDCHGKDLGGAKVVDDPVAARIYGPNITPSALGDWSDDDIARIIRYGVRPDGHPAVLMPSHEYQNLSRGDLAAAVAFLRSVEPVERENVEIKVGPLFKALYALGEMPTLIPAEIADQTAYFVEKPEERATREFGEYLVKSSCVGCHGGDLSGGPIPGGPPEWPPASDIRSGTIGHWTEAQFMKLMREGVTPDGRRVRPPMPVQLTRQMNDTELLAIWKYLSAE